MANKTFSYAPTVSASNRVINPSKTYEAGALESIDEAVPQSTTTELQIAFNVAEVKAFAVTCSVACTLKTNDSGSPDETLTLVPDVPYVWTTDSYDDFWFEIDIESIFVTVPGAAAGLLRMEILRDITP